MSARLDAQASIRDGIVALSGSVRICGRQNAYITPFSAPRIL
jgi:hypothetical protein